MFLLLMQPISQCIHAMLSLTSPHTPHPLPFPDPCLPQSESERSTSSGGGKTYVPSNAACRVDIRITLIALEGTDEALVELLTEQGLCRAYSRTCKLLGNKLICFGEWNRACSQDRKDA